ncbi:MAG: hypothetical protein OEV44_04920 [Spirochaetota bacterium]|nr:hypothetical protein [Spirochaetota bacterium]
MKVVSSMDYSLLQFYNELSQSKKRNSESENYDSIKISDDKINHNQDAGTYKSLLANTGTLFVPYRPGVLQDIPLYYEDGKGTRVDNIV